MEFTNLKTDHTEGIEMYNTTWKHKNINRSNGFYSNENSVQYLNRFGF